MPTYKTSEIDAALREARGMVYIAATRLGCSPNTIKARLESSEQLRDTLLSERGKAGDTAELKLYQAVQNGEPWAIQFYLRTQGKDRGYVERQEITGANGGPVAVSDPERDRRLTALFDLARTRAARRDPTGPDQPLD